MAARRWLAVCVAVAALAGAMVSAQQGPDPQVRARMDAFTSALASGDADKYEAMARENFAPDFLARRTAAERRQFLERLRADFGQTTVSRVTTNDGQTFSLRVSGSTGLKGEIQLTLEAVAPRRITRIAVEVGQPEDNEASAPAPAINGSMSGDSLSTALDAFLSPLSAADTFAGSVLVAKNGGPVYRRAYGQANREKHVPNAMTTRFNLGSINKIFTKTAIAQLVSQGKLARTDTIGKLLPDYPNAQAKTATIDQLLEHQAGIADFFGQAFEAAPKTGFRSNADYYRFVSAQPLLFEPGKGRQVLQRLLHRAGCYHRTRFRDAVPRTTSRNMSSSLRA